MGNFTDESQEFFESLKKLVEETYAQTGNKKVVILGHSLGGPMTYHFLLNQTSDWKGKHVQAWMPIAAPFAGTVPAIDTLTRGHGSVSYLDPKSMITKLETTFSLAGVLVPSADVFGNRTLVQIESQSFTAADMGAVYDLLKDDVGKKMWRRGLQQLPSAFPGTGVQTHCIHSGSRNTPEMLVFDSKQLFPLGGKKYVYGPGDGTVNKISTDVCLMWRQQSPATVHTLDVDAEHSELVTRQQTIAYLIQTVLRVKSPLDMMTGQQ